MTNVLNFMDGLDGIAGGCSAIAMTFLSIIFLSIGSVDLATFSAIVAASSLGFFFLIFLKPESLWVIVEVNFSVFL